jgi:hypothetical protein
MAIRSMFFVLFDNPVYRPHEYSGRTVAWVTAS